MQMTKSKRTRVRFYFLKIEFSCQSVFFIYSQSYNKQIYIFVPIRFNRRNKQSIVVSTMIKCSLPKENEKKILTLGFLTQACFRLSCGVRNFEDVTLSS